MPLGYHISYGISLILQHDKLVQRCACVHPSRLPLTVCCGLQAARGGLSATGGPEISGVAAIAGASGAERVRTHVGSDPGMFDAIECFLEFGDLTLR